MNKKKQESKVSNILKHFGIVILILSSQLMANPNNKWPVVRIVATSQSPDFKSPWAMKNVDVKKSIGTVTNTGEIITSAAALDFYKRVEMELPQSTKRYPLNVIDIDYELNLAKLSANSDAGRQALKQVQSFQLGEEPEYGEVCQAVDIIGGNQISVKSIRFSRPDLHPSSHGKYATIGLRFETTSTGLGGSEPILCKNKLVGLAQASHKNEVAAINNKILNFYLNKQLNSKPGSQYSGHLGLLLYHLESVQKRAYYKAPESATGVMVGKVYEHSAFSDKLQKGDIITHIDGKDLNNNAKIKHPKWSLIHFNFYISQFSANHPIKLSIIRDGQPQEITGSLAQKNSNRGVIPRYFSDYSPAWELNYRIYGGLVFVELNLPMMSQWGSNWTRFAPSEFVNFINKDEPRKESTDKRFVVMLRVLADPDNKGYESFRSAILKNLNGKEVKNLDDLEEQIKSNNAPFQHFSFDYAAGSIVLKSDIVADLHSRIKKKFQLPENTRFIEQPPKQ